MAAVMKSWEGHCAHPHLPRSMAFRLSKAGFRLDGAAVFPILNLQYTDDGLQYTDDGYSKGIAQFIRNFVSNKKDVSSNDVIEWHRELERLNESGRYFFSTNRYIFKASKSS